jgi:hypothetical protein
VGLLPYITVLGVTAAAGGGAILTIKKPADSRLILACDSLSEAIAWKSAIELSISKLGSIKRHVLPLTTDFKVISSLIEINFNKSLKRVGICDGVRIMKHLSPPHDTLCRCAQLGK